MKAIGLQSSTTQFGICTTLILGFLLVATPYVSQANTKAQYSADLTRIASQLVQLQTALLAEIEAEGDLANVDLGIIIDFNNLVEELKIINQSMQRDPFALDGAAPANPSTTESAGVDREVLYNPTPGVASRPTTPSQTPQPNLTPASAPEVEWVELIHNYDQDATKVRVHLNNGQYEETTYRTLDRGAIYSMVQDEYANYFPAGSEVGDYAQVRRMVNIINDISVMAYSVNREIEVTIYQEGARSERVSIPLPPTETEITDEWIFQVVEERFGDHIWYPVESITGIEYEEVPGAVRSDAVSDIAIYEDPTAPRTIAFIRYSNGDMVEREFRYTNLSDVEGELTREFHNNLGGDNADAFVRGISDHPFIVDIEVAASPTGRTIIIPTYSDGSNGNGEMEVELPVRDLESSIINYIEDVYQSDLIFSADSITRFVTP